MPCKKVVRTKVQESEYQNIKRLKNAEAQKRQIEKKENKKNSMVPKDAGSVPTDLENCQKRKRTNEENAKFQESKKLRHAEAQRKHKLKNK